MPITHTAIINSSVEIIDDASHFISSPNSQTRSQKIYNSSSIVSDVASESNSRIILIPPPTDPAISIPFTVVSIQNLNTANTNKFVNLSTDGGEFYLKLEDGVNSITIKTNQFSMSNLTLNSNPNLVLSIGNATNPLLEQSLSIQIIILGGI